MQGERSNLRTTAPVTCLHGKGILPAPFQFENFFIFFFYFIVLYSTAKLRERERENAFNVLVLTAQYPHGFSFAIFL